MRVLIINSVCGRQSTGRIVSDIRKELILQGHECVIAYGEKNSIDIEQNFHIGSELERYVHGMYTRLFDKHCYGSKHATRELVEFIKKYNPDIIHLHNIHGYYLNMEILFNYLKKVQKPIVWTLHDCWIFTGHCSYFTAVKCEQWKQGCDNCPQLKMYPSSWLVDNSKNNWNKKKELFTGLNTVKIITPSYWLAQLVKESFMKEYSVDVIYNGINQSIFKYEPSNIREKYDICDKKKIILGVASIWEKRKGIDDFIVLQKKLESTHQVILVGNMCKKDRSRCLEAGIITVEATDNIKELTKLYSGADVFVNTTYEDNFPTVNIEALSCGTPVITYATGGSPECLNNDVGVSVPVGDIDKLAKAVKEFKCNRDKCMQKGRTYSVNNFVKSYLNIYKEILN